VRAPRKLIACAALALVGGCGALGPSDNVDAGPPGDASPSCSFSFSVSPSPLFAPVTVVLTAVVNDGGFTGFQNFSWTVMNGGTDVAYTDNSGDLSEITFSAPTPGQYYVAIAGDIGGRSCTGSSTTLNVMDPGAGSTQYRLRLVPAPGQPAPTQARIIRVYGGANATLDPIALDNGYQVGATVKGPGGTPIAAYLRLKQVGGLGGDVETFADAAGQFSVWLTPALYDILVVPVDESVAPMKFSSVDVTTLTELSVAQGDAITGTVLEPSGQPLANARVALRIDGVPSTIATTDGGGAFTLYARTGGATSVTVVPEQSSLPQLELDTSAGLVAASGTPLAIQYAGGLSSRSVSLVVNQSDGTTPVPAASLTWIGNAITMAGSVTPSGGSALAATGRVRITATADGAGAITGLSLPETGYTVLVQPSPGTPASELLTLRSVDLSPGMTTPTSLALSTGATITGTVTDTDNVVLAGVRVTATPTGVLANSPSTAASSMVTDAQGNYSLTLVGNGDYDLRFDSLAANHGQLVVPVMVPAPGGSGQQDARMAPAVKVSGKVTIPGLPGGAPGVSVSALCFSCSGADAVRPVADAVSGPDGSFVLAIPDPEVQSQPN